MTMILMQTHVAFLPSPNRWRAPPIDSGSKTVKYSEYRFDLRKCEEAFNFLRELYNCSDVIDSPDNEIKRRPTKIQAFLNTSGQLPSFGASRKKRKQLVKQ
ncbi:hypothetical protein BT69DRAFT_1318789 [Atractiella rhizophila]|nr:hypothetical protein BT69DRAFT_1318789 [Atractiella rhizophila]